MAQGQAVVLDNPRDPMGMVLMGQQQQATNRYRQQQLGLQQRKAADADMNKVLAYKYEKPEDRFREWGQNIVNSGNQEVMDIYERNPNADPISLRSQIMQVQGAHQKKLDYGITTSKIFTEKQKSLDGMKDIVDPEESKRIMNQIISVDDPYKVNRSLLENIEQVPAIYDRNALVANSVSDIKDQFRNVTPGDIQSSQLGLFMEIKENKMRFKDMDKTMDFLLRGDDVTDIGIQQKINGGLISDRIRYDIAAQEVSKSGGDAQDVTQVMDRFKQIQYDPKYAPQVRKELKSVLDQFNQEERDVDVQSMGKFKQESMNEGLKKNRLMLRDQNLKNILNPYSDPGSSKPKAESQAAISRILGGDFGGGKVTQAGFEKGQYTTSPDWTKKISEELNQALSDNSEDSKKQLQQTLREAKNHLVSKTGNKIKFNIKTGTIYGQPEETSGLTIDLSDPNAEAIVNALMNKNAGEANIPLDDVNFYRNQGKQTYLDDDDETPDDGYLD